MNPKNKIWSIRIFLIIALIIFTIWWGEQPIRHVDTTLEPFETLLSFVPLCILLALLLTIDIFKKRENK